MSNEQAAMTLWAMRMSLATNNCQSAVETIYDTAKRNDMLDTYEFNELTQHLEKVCELLGLHDDFLEDEGLTFLDLDLDRIRAEVEVEKLSQKEATDAE